MGARQHQHPSGRHRYTHAHTHTHTHGHTHTDTHAHTHALAHTQTHTRTCTRCRTTPNEQLRGGRDSPGTEARLIATALQIRVCTPRCQTPGQGRAFCRQPGAQPPTTPTPLLTSKRTAIRSRPQGAALSALAFTYVNVKKTAPMATMLVPVKPAMLREGPAISRPSNRKRLWPCHRCHRNAAYRSVGT